MSDEPKDYDNITIDYTALRNAADRLKKMRDQWDKLDLSDYTEQYTLANPNGGGTTMGGGRPKDQDQIGHRRLAKELGLFHSGWDGPVKHSKERVEQLAKTYDQVAHTWEDHDNSLASSVNVQTFQAALGKWHSDKEAYENFQSLKEEHVTRKYWGKDGKRHTEQVPLVDPDSDQGPPKPGPKPGRYTTWPDSTDMDDGTKLVSDVDADFDDDGEIVIHDQKTTITDKNGESYTEKTEFKDDGGSTTKIEHSDGSTETVTVTNDGDGNATKKDVTKDETTTYHAKDFDKDSDKEPTWKEEGDDSSSSSDSSSSNDYTPTPGMKV